MTMFMEFCQIKNLIAMKLSLDYLLRIRPELVLPHDIGTAFGYGCIISFKDVPEDSNNIDLDWITSKVGGIRSGFVPMKISIKSLTAVEKWNAFYRGDTITVHRNKFDCEERKALSKMEVKSDYFCPIDGLIQQVFVECIESYNFNFEQIQKLKRLSTAINIYTHCDVPSEAIESGMTFPMTANSVRTAAKLLR